MDSDPVSRSKCDLIYNLLYLLLLREHSRRRLARTGATDASTLRPHTDPAFSPASIQSAIPLLQPVIDLLQYEFFCVRVRAEMNKIVQILRRAGVPVKFHFATVGEDGTGILESLIGGGAGYISGATTIRIDNRQVTKLAVVRLIDTMCA